VVKQEIERIYESNLDVAEADEHFKNESAGSFIARAQENEEAQEKEEKEKEEKESATLKSKKKTNAGDNKKNAKTVALSKIKMNATMEDIELLRNQVKRGGHTVIIMLEDHDELDQHTMWEQLHVIIRCLVYAQDHTPLVVAHSLSALPSRCKFMKKYFDILQKVPLSFCVGDVLDPCVLQASGCHTCARILTLAPSAPPTEKSQFDSGSIVSKSDDKMDENHIFLMKILNEYKAPWKRQEHVKVVFDW
jgi:hypothetical protein